MLKHCKRCGLEIEDTMGIVCCPYCGFPLSNGPNPKGSGAVIKI